MKYFYEFQTEMNDTARIRKTVIKCKDWLFYSCKIFKLESEGLIRLYSLSNSQNARIHSIVLGSDDLEKYARSYSSYMSM